LPLHLVLAFVLHSFNFHHSICYCLKLNSEVL
jgi:hypothetical protein